MGSITYRNWRYGASFTVFGASALGGVNLLQVTRSGRSSPARHVVISSPNVSHTFETIFPEVRRRNRKSSTEVGDRSGDELIRPDKAECEIVDILLLDFLKLRGI
jgi:hypothetical protein